MKVRGILWYRKEEEYWRFHALSMYSLGEWFVYSFLEAPRYALTRDREEFEQDYLTYQGRKNEG